MANFPVLKCGAVAQYPSDKTRSFSTRVLQFADGSEQRFPRFSADLKRWSIKLQLLDEGELQQMEKFLEDQAGRYGVFSFTDPWEGIVYQTCSFERDDVVGKYEGWSRGSTELLILENR